MDESRQVGKLQRNAAERMNSLEGVGGTASSPPLQKARLEEPLDGEQEKTGKDETELISLEDALMMKSRKSPSLCSLLDNVNLIARSFHQLPQGNVPSYEEAERVQWNEWVKSRGSLSSSVLLEELKSLLPFAKPSREVEEPPFFETPSPGPCEGEQMRQAQGGF